MVSDIKMIEFDCDKAAANCSKNISFSKDIVNNLPDLSLGTDEADTDSILVGNDATANKSLEYSHCSINSSQMIEDKNRKRKPSRTSFKYIGSLFNKLVLKVSSVSSDASDLKKYEILSPEYFELGQMIEQMLNQKMISPNHMPGVIGLLNQGNNCYMNAILQCLSNTDQLTAYFLSDHYRTCLKLNHGVRNCGRFSNISTFTHSTTTLNSGLEYVCGQELGKKSFSRSRGIVTEHLAFLLRSMWSGRSCNEPLSRFKNLVGRMGKQFKGSTQQDAHEFLLWLLDQLHEDLSINFDATKKKSSKSGSCVRGNTSLEDYSTVGSASICQPSQSAINDLFQAHYRSSLTCLKCGHRSHTFDPFLTISLSILSSSSLSLGLKHPIYVVVVYLSATPKQVKIGLQMKHGCTIKDLRDTISNDTNIPRDQLVIADVRLDGHVTTLFENQPIENFRNLSSIYAIEIPRINQVENHVIMVIVNKFENGAQYEKFGDPVVLLMHDSSSFFDMQQDLFMEIKQHILIGLNNYFFSKSFLDLRLVNFDNRSDCYYMSSDLFPLRSSTVSRALERCTSGPRHIVVVAEWYQMTRNDFSQSMNDSCVEHESVNVVRSAQCSPSCSLEDCFHVYTQKEQLGADNAWYCPSCNKKQIETLKTLTLWSLPKILVVHLKRFKHDSSQRTKLDTFITFPTRDLDLSDYLSKNIPQATMSANNGYSQASPAYDNKGELAAKKSDSSHDSNVICPQNLPSFSKVTNLSKSKHNETTSTESSLDCLPIIMKNVNNERTPLSIVANDHNSSNRRLSNGSSQNEFRIKNICAPSAVNLQTCRESHNASQGSLKDLQSNNNCENCKNELYDLYAVCNHYGNLHDGHYTAYCKSPISNTWYLFNDTYVSPIREEEVVTKHAYLLFYKKKTVLTHCQSTCASSLNKGTLNESPSNLRNEERETPSLNKCSHHMPSKTFPQIKKQQTSLLSRFRTSIAKRAISTTSHRPINNTNHDEKDIPSTCAQTELTDDSTKHSQPPTTEKKHDKKSPHRNKVFQGTRRLLDCTGSCVLSSNESVVCPDIQLSRLHSLQESRV